MMNNNDNIYKDRTSYPQNAKKNVHENYPLNSKIIHSNKLGQLKTILNRTPQSNLYCFPVNKIEKVLKRTYSRPAINKYKGGKYTIIKIETNHIDRQNANSIIPIYPSSLKHAPSYDYELTPIEYVRYHKSSVAESEKSCRCQKQ